MLEFDRSSFVAKFQEEAQDLLQRLNEAVIQLESAPSDRELVDGMLRDAHTLKGSSRMVGLIEISDIAHRLEDVLVRVRDGELAYEPGMSDRVFDALDAILFLSENSGVDEDGVLDVEGLQTSLAALASPGFENTVEIANATASSEAPDACEDDSGEARPDGPVRDVPCDSELKSKVQSTVRIRTDQLDALLNLVSEVVIAQSKAEQRGGEVRALQQQAGQLSHAWTHTHLLISAGDGSADCEIAQEEVESLGELLGRHTASVTELSKQYADDISRSSLVVAELQEQAMRLRMLPASTIFQSFPRSVRDLARQFNKQIELEIEGGETELDKRVLEEINDPLIHIVRNAIDHGIETPEQRGQLGKPASGTIRLSARQEGDRIVIEVSDDGAGIDPETIREAAVRKGYLSAAEAGALSDREAMYLIFEAGFSTAAIITEISGRGVGMDVVREYVVEKLKGSLDVYSRRGKGTTFRLTLPLTLAIIRALLLKVGGQTLALPTVSVDETVRIDPAEIVRVEGREAIKRGRRTIPLVHLSDLLGIVSDGRRSIKVPIVVIGHSGHRMGFIVDGFEGEQQIVIKPLGSHLKDVDNVAGVTILGAGELVPILDVPDLMTNARTRSGQRTGGSADRNSTERARTILICEDSFTTRELERSIFEAAGYEVETAVDGAAGLARLRDGARVDAVVTDVQMPNMTGFELTRAIKQDPALARLPVIVVTSLERDEEKAEGIGAGADAYITKSVFNQETLLDTVERLIR